MGEVLDLGVLGQERAEVLLAEDKTPSNALVNLLSRSRPPLTDKLRGGET